MRPEARITEPTARIVPSADRKDQTADGVPHTPALRRPGTRSWTTSGLLLTSQIGNYLAPSPSFNSLSRV